MLALKRILYDSATCCNLKSTVIYFIRIMILLMSLTKIILISYTLYDEQQKYLFFKFTDMNCIWIHHLPTIR